MVDGQNAASTNGGLGPIQVYQNSNVTNSDAFMTFHISNRYATYFGLDRETNDLFTGGWSDGAVKHKIWHAVNAEEYHYLFRSGKWVCYEINPLGLELPKIVEIPSGALAV